MKRRDAGSDTDREKPCADSWIIRCDMMLPPDDPRLANDPTGTFLGEYRRILASPRDYGHSDQFAVFNMSDIWNALPSHRLDPKYHLFKPNESESVPTGWVSKLERELMKRWEHVYTRNKLWICTSR